MTDRATKETQYQPSIDIADQHGQAALGLMINQAWHDDPKRLTFTFARYKFAAKMLSGKGRVLEVGCGDGFVSRVVRQEVGELVAIDFDPVFVDDVNSRMIEKWRFEARVHDILAAPVPPGGFDAAYSLDVMEHIQPVNEQAYLSNIAASLHEHGVFIAGMPSIESQEYASPPSKAGHVNCKSAPELKASLERHFHNVFSFSMNDEVVHTGYHKMAHYIFAMGVGRK
ncbi:MAG: class I SAM-dependent methyltransferase [Pseudomonadota bacterium]